MNYDSNRHLFVYCSLTEIDILYVLFVVSNDIFCLLFVCCVLKNWRHVAHAPQSSSLHTTTTTQGPARRPAVFSHDKLVWDWVQELLLGMSPPCQGDAAPAAMGIKAEQGTAHDSGLQQQERQGSGSSAATTLDERPRSSAASREGVRLPLREFCAKVLEMPLTDLQKLPQQVRV